MSVVAAKSYVGYRNDAYWVEGTRIFLDSVVYAFRRGLSPENIVQSFPLLTWEQIYSAIAFYLANRVEIDAYLATEEVAFDAMPQPLQTTDPALYNKLMAAKSASRQRDREVMGTLVLVKGAVCDRGAGSSKVCRLGQRPDSEL